MPLKDQLSALFLLAVFLAGGVYAPLGHWQGHDEVHSHDHPELTIAGFGDLAAEYLTEASTVTLDPTCQLCARLVFKKHVAPAMIAPDAPSRRHFSCSCNSLSVAAFSRAPIRAPPLSS